jgi:transmembrane sensor
MNRDNYTTLISKLVTGEISSEEKEILDRWLNQSPDHNEYYKKILQYWENSKQPEPKFFPKIEEQWFELENRLGWRSRLKPGGWLQTLSEYMHACFFENRRAFVAAAAAICLVFITLLVWQTPLNPFRYQLISTANKEKQNIILSDGSEVIMNSASCLKYRKDFSDLERKVDLTGEAFFIVMSDHRPFIIITENAKTEVIGTEFNVWARNRQTRVIVKEGKVKLSTLATAVDHTILSKGQMSSVVNDTLSRDIEQVDVNHLLGWLENQLVFDETPVKEVLDEVMRFYDIVIEVVDPELYSLKITALFDNKPVEVVLTSICLAIHAQYKFDQGKYSIEKKNGDK